MNLLDNKIYIEDLKNISNILINWSDFNDKSFMISGATGMIGSFFIDVMMYRNKYLNANHHIIALGRDIEKAKNRFNTYFTSEYFTFIECDINRDIPYEKDVDFIFHLASSTHPKQYSEEPISTIMANVIGTKNLLDFACNHNCKKFVFASSVEIYGENKGDVDEFTEEYLGYIDCNTLRAGYSEGKRLAESLCQAYIKEKGIDIVIPRFARVYGPTMLMSDTKALSQFIKKGILKEDIILKSEGKQLFSYVYVADAVSAMITLLSRGNAGQAYNVSDFHSNITLKELAENIASYVSKKVIYELPDSIEKAGYSTATKAILDSTKLERLEWEAKTDILEGIKKTLTILKSEE